MWTSNTQTYLRFFLVSIILILVGTLSNIHTLETIPYSALSHTSSLGLLVTTEQGVNETNTVVYRLQDGIPQEIPGKWQHTFTEINEIFFYGFPREQPNNQAVIALTNLGADIKNVSGLPGRITGISPSPDSTYLMITGVHATESTPYTCIILRTTKSYDTCKNVFRDILTPDQLSPVYTYLSFWHPKKTAELVILEDSPARRAFSYVPAEKTGAVREITDETEKEILLNDLNQQLAETETATEPFSTFGPLVYTIDEKTNTRRFFIEFGQKKFLRLSDRLTLLTKDDGLWVIDSINKQKALLTPVENRNALILDYFSRVSP